MSMWYPPNNDFFETVWLIVRQIPHGKVSTYGQIASMIPPAPDGDAEQHQRLAPRWVGTAMRKVDADVPWQRVINSQGKISERPGFGVVVQRKLLEDEGVVFDDRDRVDLKRFGWRPDPVWLRANGLTAPDEAPSDEGMQRPLFYVRVSSLTSLPARRATFAHIPRAHSDQVDPAV